MWSDAVIILLDVVALAHAKELVEGKLTDRVVRSLSHHGANLDNAMLKKVGPPIPKAAAAGPATDSQKNNSDVDDVALWQERPQRNAPRPDTATLSATTPAIAVTKITSGYF